MRLLFDASSLLNLANGGVLEIVLKIPNLNARIGQLVRDECSSIEKLLDGLIENREIEFLNDDNLSATVYSSFLQKYELGPGETECLAFASIGDDVICCDDKKARNAAIAEFGSRRVTGTIGLLVQLVKYGMATIDEAYLAYEQMRRCGAFLPAMSLAEFTDLASA